MTLRRYALRTAVGVITREQGLEPRKVVTEALAERVAALAGLKAALDLATLQPSLADEKELHIDRAYVCSGSVRTRPPRCGSTAKPVPCATEASASTRRPVRCAGSSRPWAARSRSCRPSLRMESSTSLPPSIPGVPCVAAVPEASTAAADISILTSPPGRIAFSPAHAARPRDAAAAYGRGIYLGPCCPRAEAMHSQLGLRTNLFDLCHCTVVAHMHVLSHFPAFTKHTACLLYRCSRWYGSIGIHWKDSGKCRRYVR